MALNSTPNASDIISFTQPLIKSNFDGINGGFNVDHVEFNTSLPYTGGDAGKHKQVTFTSGGVAPVGAGEFGLYTAGGALRLIKVGAFDIPISGTGASGATFTYLPGNVFMQFFVMNITTAKLDTDYNYPNPFPNAAFGIVGTMKLGIGDTVPANVGVSATIKVGADNKTKFRAGSNYVSTNGAIDVYFIAIGN